MESVLENNWTQLFSQLLLMHCSLVVLSMGNSVRNSMKKLTTLLVISSSFLHCVSAAKQCIFFSSIKIINALINHWADSTINLNKILLRNTQNNWQLLLYLWWEKLIILALMLKLGMREGFRWEGCLLLLKKNPVERLNCWQEWEYLPVSSHDSHNGSQCQAELPCQVLSFCFSEKNKNG